MLPAFTFWTLGATSNDLLELKLRANTKCLKRLQGLRTTAACCQNLQGLDLSYISVNDVESQVELWEIIAELKLTYLAVSSCVLMSDKADEQTKGVLIGLYQKCVHLKALEFDEKCCEKCRSEFDYQEVLSSFASLAYLHLPFGIDMKWIFSGCKQLKYLLGSWFDPFRSFTLNCNLEQLYINSYRIHIPDTFMETISAHGGLVHVVIKVRTVTGDGITALVGNSPQLMTCHILAENGIFASINEDVRLKLRDFKMSLKNKFSNRKLFSSGCYSLTTGFCRIYLDSTELNSLFYSYLY